MDKLTITGNFDEISVNGVAYGPKQEPNPEPGPTPTPDPDPPAPSPVIAGGLGFNVNDQRYWDGIQIFANLMATPSFFTQDPNCVFSEAGYPQRGRSMILLAVHGGRRSPLGNYIVRHSGSGRGPDSFKVEPGQKNVRLHFEGEIGEDIDIRHEDHQSLTFTPTFAARAQLATWMRFLDPLWTNWAPATYDPNQEDDVRTERGAGLWVHRMMTPEQIALIANTFSVNPWTPVFHLATPEKIESWARRLFNALDPRILVRSENSNEIWNGAFPQSKYADDRGSRQKWHADRTEMIGQIWHGVFGNRSTTVLGSQLDSPALLDGAYEKTTFEGLPHVKAAAVNGYIGGDWCRENERELKTGYPHRTIHDAMVADFKSRVIRKLDAWLEIAEKRGLTLDMYECGLHCAPKHLNKFPAAVDRLHEYVMTEDAGEITGDLHARRDVARCERLVASCPAVCRDAAMLGRAVAVLAERVI